jgi:hypothetical protein
MARDVPDGGAGVSGSPCPGRVAIPALTVSEAAWACLTRHVARLHSSRSPPGCLRGPRIVTSFPRPASPPSRIARKSTSSVGSGLSTPSNRTPDQELSDRPHCPMTSIEPPITAATRASPISVRYCLQLDLFGHSRGRRRASWSLVTSTTVPRSRRRSGDLQADRGNVSWRRRPAVPVGGG